MTDVLQVRAVTHGDRGDHVPVLVGVDLQVAAGELVALVGRSGSGKSTLCQLVAGLEAPHTGQVLVDGGRADRVRSWSTVAYQPQRLGLAPELTVSENALLPCWLADQAPAGDLLAGLGLAHIATRPAGQTSLGEQQRTGVARVLALSSRLVVLDEPTGHQDDANLALVLAALTTAARTGSAVLVATHDPSVIAAADRAVHLDGGRVVPGPDRTDQHAPGH